MTVAAQPGRQFSGRAALSRRTIWHHAPIKSFIAPTPARPRPPNKPPRSLFVAASFRGGTPDLRSVSVSVSLGDQLHRSGSRQRQGRFLARSVVSVARPPQLLEGIQRRTDDVSLSHKKGGREGKRGGEHNTATERPRTRRHSLGFLPSFLPSLWVRISI